jgi:hypothetical protein
VPAVAARRMIPTTDRSSLVRDAVVSLASISSLLVFVDSSVRLVEV